MMSNDHDDAQSHDCKITKTGGGEKDVHVPDKISVHQAWRRRSLHDKLDRFTPITVNFSIL